MTRVKAITVKQPWAWAIVHGGKDVENRSQMFAHRGLLAIHAAKVDDSGGYGDTRIRALADAGLRMPAFDDRGHVIGVAHLIACHWGRDVNCHCESPWAELGSTHLVLSGARPLAEPVAARGLLGLWDLPDDVAAAVQGQLGGAS